MSNGKVKEVKLDMGTYVPAAILAELFGQQPDGVRLLAQKEIIPKPNQGLYPAWSCIRDYIKYLRQFSQGKNPANYSKANQAELSNKQRLEKARADMQELKVKQEEGRLVEIEVLERQLDEITSTLRQRLLNIPVKAATLLVGEDDPDVIKDQVEQLVYEALTDLSEAETSASSDHDPKPKAGARNQKGTGQLEATA